MRPRRVLRSPTCTCELRFSAYVVTHARGAVRFVSDRVAELSYLPTGLIGSERAPDIARAWHANFDARRRRTRDVPLDWVEPHIASRRRRFIVRRRSARHWPPIRPSVRPPRVTAVTDWRRYFCLRSVRGIDDVFEEISKALSCVRALVLFKAHYKHACIISHKNTMIIYRRPNHYVLRLIKSSQIFRYGRIYRLTNMFWNCDEITTMFFYGRICLLPL